VGTRGANVGRGSQGLMGKGFKRCHEFIFVEDRSGVITNEIVALAVLKEMFPYYTFYSAMNAVYLIPGTF
jgi:hypothetical protein